MLRIVLVLLAAASAAWAQTETTPVRVGIFGTVTDIEPLEINGIQFDVSPDMPVLSPLGLRTVADLRMGHTLALTALDRQEGWQIKRALYVYPLIGPVGKAAQGTLEVMESRVVSADPTMFEGIGQGAWVGVSGMWQGDRVITSRTGAIRATGIAQVSGNITRDTADGEGVRIGGTSLTGDLPAEPEEGEFWVFSGTPKGSGLEIELRSRGLFAQAVELVFAEGYPSDAIASETYMIFGTGLIGHARESDMPDQDAPIQVCAVDGFVLNKPPADARLARTAARLGCLSETAPDR